GYVVYHCKKDVLVKSAYIVNNYGDFEAHLYADETPSEESEAETAGGIVSYQWQISEDAQNYTDIPNATEKTFSLTKENADSLIRKALRVKITQNYEGQEHESIYSEGYAVYHKMVKSELYYDGVLIVGEDFDTSKIKGTVTDELGNVYDERGNWVTNGALYEKGYYTASVSKSFQVIMWKDLFYDTTLDVFAIVQNDLSEDELPSLSTDTYSINVGKVRFNSINKNLEISLDGGIIYEDFPDDEFNASAGQVLYLRKKAVGTPNTNGYIKESRPLTITVETKNVGRRTEGGSIIGGLEMLEFTLKKTSANGKITITPKFSYTEEYWSYDYTWQIDGADVSLYNGTAVNEANELVITTSEFGSDIYQIFCCVRIYVEELDPSYQYDLATVSAQITAVIE
ncbi:MAG: hypothetical protein J6Y01_05800, partial [Spirochaetales bacterium]|nr:hypothetical protein [Spirochaetales bacterium]